MERRLVILGETPNQAIQLDLNRQMIFARNNIFDWRPGAGQKAQMRPRRALFGESSGDSGQRSSVSQKALPRLHRAAARSDKRYG
jgi:hypothetical protein